MSECMSVLSSSIDSAGTVLLQSGGGGGGAGILGGLFFIVLALLAFGAFIAYIAGMWKVFEKAGQPGWGALVPILNILYMLDMADRETWWIILFFIPVINGLIFIVINIDIAKNFGKGPGYGLAMWLLPFVFWPLLGFGDETYVGDTSPGV